MSYFHIYFSTSVTQMPLLVFEKDICNEIEDDGSGYRCVSHGLDEWALNS